jgi:hypothetical protein
MWQTVFARLLNDPVSVYLLAGDILATFAVGLGIVWEHGPPEIRAVANRLVIGGIVVETICSVLLFGYDSNVIGSQNDKIIALEKRLAARTLTDDQIAAIVEQLKPFKGQEFDVVTYWKNPESLAFTNRIYGGLISAGWKYDKPPNGEFILGVETGVVVWHDDRASVGTILAAKELIAALNANNADASADEAPQAHGPNEPIVSKIVINVGIKP